jgi:hypothetical protein
MLPGNDFEKQLRRIFPSVGPLEGTRPGEPASLAHALEKITISLQNQAGCPVTFSRTTATQLADELLSTVLVDTGNAGCYTLPNPSGCTSSAAALRAADWKVRALAALPGDHTAVATLDGGTQRFTVTVTWTGKGGSDPHTLQVSTDAR